VDEEPKLRPLPPPPRCRGIPLGDGNYTGCAYGYRDVAPFTGPRDCPVCNGSGFEGHIETTLPHSDFGGGRGFYVLTPPPYWLLFAPPPLNRVWKKPLRL
jgi:hypothetical protein